MANPVGRPSKYNEDIQHKADEYIYKWQEIGDSIPSRVGLCVYLGICKQTSYLWEEYPQFLDTLKKIDTLQEYVGVNKGLTSDFNSTIVKLVLANHGYSDRVQQDMTSSDGSMTPKRIERVVVDADSSDKDA